MARCGNVNHVCQTAEYIQQFAPFGNLLASLWPRNQPVVEAQPLSGPNLEAIPAGILKNRGPLHLRSLDLYSCSCKLPVATCWSRNPDRELDWQFVRGVEDLACQNLTRPLKRPRLPRQYREHLVLSITRIRK